LTLSAGGMHATSSTTASQLRWATTRSRSDSSGACNTAHSCFFLAGGCQRHFSCTHGSVGSCLQTGQPPGCWMLIDCSRPSFLCLEGVTMWCSAAVLASRSGAVSCIVDAGGGGPQVTDPRGATCQPASQPALLHSHCQVQLHTHPLPEMQQEAAAPRKLI
jgi:hypothetical protein